MNTVFTMAPGPQQTKVFSDNHIETFQNLDVTNMVIFRQIVLILARICLRKHRRKAYNAK